MQPNLISFTEEYTEGIAYKKALFLLHTVILSYNTLDDEEKIILENMAVTHEMKEELEWALAFVNENLFTAFKRMIEYFSEHLENAPKRARLELVFATWKSVLSKGAVSEVEALALLKTARVLGIESDFVNLIRKN